MPKQFSEETRRRMSESAKRRCANPAWIESQHQRGTQLPEEEVRALYQSGHTQSEIAAMYGVTQKTVFRFMRNHGIPARTAAKREQRGESNSSWKGGRRVERGYVEIYMPDHPRSKKNGYVYEHIVIAETMLGRPLIVRGKTDERTEIVHHINGDKGDNRPENLLVMGIYEHQRLHRAELQKAVDGILLKRIRHLEQELKSLYDKEEHNDQRNL